MVSRFDGLNISGIWRDPVSNASGKWKLSKISQEGKVGRSINKEKRFQESLSKKAG